MVLLYIESKQKNTEGGHPHEEVYNRSTPVYAPNHVSSNRDEVKKFETVWNN
jgi:hypothetical protein